MVRAPSIPTVKALFAVSGNVCAFPECDRPLVDQSSNVVIGEVCHIEAASPAGPDMIPNSLKMNGKGSRISFLCALRIIKLLTNV